MVHFGITDLARGGPAGAQDGAAVAGPDGAAAADGVLDGVVPALGLLAQDVGGGKLINALGVPGALHSI